MIDMPRPKPSAHAMLRKMIDVMHTVSSALHRHQVAGVADERLCTLAQEAVARYQTCIGLIEQMRKKERRQSPDGRHGGRGLDGSEKGSKP